MLSGWLVVLVAVVHAPALTAAQTQSGEHPAIPVPGSSSEMAPALPASPAPPQATQDFLTQAEAVALARALIDTPEGWELDAQLEDRLDPPVWM